MKNFLGCVLSIATFVVVNVLLFKFVMFLVSTDIGTKVLGINSVLSLIIILALIFAVCKASIWSGFLVISLINITKPLPLMIYNAAYMIVFAFSTYQMFVTPNPWFFKVPIIITYIGYVFAGLMGIIASRDMVEEK